MYAKIENGKIITTTANIRKEYPNTSFPPAFSADEFRGWKKVEMLKAEPPEGKVYDRTETVLVEGNPVQNHIYRDKTAAELEVDWQAEIRATDALLPRWAEDIIDALDAPVRARIALDTLSKYNTKKDVRNRKPKEK